ncbi:GMC family oxidoreductase [Segnochrobactrum spirostomi]|uniref:FAD-dependent oxidoreductase n=1 Tax=Segnochrobactrum spirostomi TaxID=2608987 RepID=A0A6A7Y7C3_9HYPH|nr:GMC family oxidoreductase N-terminal domain-containing protein [Segnochrobactrum spirostomi]MQT14716.1 FAD-dependent oxidoreductase [Segnochrobactrum spirostomi]
MSAGGSSTAALEADYIVVGAGSAGCVVAGRLAQSGRYRVLLIEAGPRDTSPWIHLPIGYGMSFYNPRVNWMYRTEPVPGLDGRVIYQPRGKVIGGSSSINAMVYSRGQASDFEAWAAMGNPGWGWPEVLAAYRRIEDHALGESRWHGAGGPLAVTDIRDNVHPLSHVFVAAGKEAGYRFNPDLNGETIEGIGYYQINTRGGFRVSAARAWLRPAARSRALRIETDALVTRIDLEGRRAVGITFERSGATIAARARREVILCGGAINTPQLLQLSGIGPGSALRGLGLAVRHDLPAVGAHLQDHLCHDHVYRSRRPSLNDDLLPLAGKVRVGLRYLLTRGGPLSLSVNQGGGFVRSAPEVAAPDIQLYFSPLSYERALPGVRALMKPDAFSGFSMSISPCNPTSRGEIALRSPDPRVAPEIRARYLDTEEDRRIALAGVRILRRIAATPAMAALIAEEIKPGSECEDDAAMLADIRARAYSVFHPCGSCRMGPDARAAVVDARLRVHGLDGLRVVDASVFPLVTSGNTNAPAMMVGERGATFILEDAAAG